MPDGDLSTNTTITEAAGKAAGRFFEKFHNQRTEYEDVWKIADYMVKCAQNRSLNEEEMTKGANPSWTHSDNENAETGSTIFFRQHRQLASQLASVALSRPVPFRYSPVINESVFFSAEEASAQADQWNTLAKWTMKMDRFGEKIIDFAHQLKKYGNTPVLFFMHRKIAEDGTILENWPSWRVEPVDSLFADCFIGNLQDQDCVILVSLQGKHKLLEMARSGEYNPAQAKKVDSSIKWDRSTSFLPMKEHQYENQDMSMPEEATEQWLCWDVFMRCPIKNRKWDDEGDLDKVHWITWWGNRPGDDNKSVCVRFEENYDPDNEIPVWMIHDIPDDPDMLYHIAPSQVIRSNYSVECTVKNQLVDHNSIVNHPPLKEVEGEVRGTDRTFGPNKVFRVDRAESISEFQIRDISVSNIQLLEYIKNDTKEALSTTSNVLGEAYGGRTSALEAGNAYRNSIQPHMITVRYNLSQFLGVLARKMHRYWETYAAPGQIVAITDENQLRTVLPEALFGEFDIQIDIVDEYEDDVVHNQRIYDVLQLIGSSPEMAKHVDIGELLKEWLRKSKLDYAKIIRPQQDADAEVRAREENAAMIAGEMISPQDGENHGVHLAVHQGERLRYKGIEEQYPTVALLDQHIEQTKMLVAQQGQASGSPPAPNRSQGAGALQGNQVAAALGGQLGG